MAIDPTGKGGINAFDAARTAQQAAREKPKDTDDAPAAAARAAADTVQLSQASRSLVGAASDAPATKPVGPALTPERLRNVLERVQNGFYDRSPVRDTIVARAAKDLASE